MILTDADRASGTERARAARPLSSRIRRREALRAPSARDSNVKFCPAWESRTILFFSSVVRLLLLGIFRFQIYIRRENIDIWTENICRHNKKKL